MEDQDLLEKAKKRVYELKGYYIHLITYFVVNIFLLILNLLTSPDELWFYWPMLGWGIGILSHTWSIFGKNMFFGRNWEDRKIKELMNKDKGGAA